MKGSPVKRAAGRGGFGAIGSVGSVAAWCLLSPACAPDFDEDPGLVRAPRVLAVQSEPAEASPGTPLTFRALIAAPGASDSVPTLSWNFCTAPKPPTENNVVASACTGDEALLAAGRGSSIETRVPFEACSLFGPDTPPGDFRPRDPDGTGGYYQPLRVDFEGQAPLFHLQRITCGLGQAPSDIASAFGTAYTPNRNPVLRPVAVRVAGQEVDTDHIPSGARVELEASWSDADAESYSYFDRGAQLLMSKREALRVIWYVSAGQLDRASTGRAEDDSELRSANLWTAPRSGAVKLWVVLRDSRGGVDFRTLELQIAK